MRSVWNIIAAVLLFTGITMTAQAQSGGNTGESTQLGFSPVTMGMSNAMTATQSVGIFPYYNPALAAIYADYSQVDLSVASLQFDRVYQTAGVTFKLPPKAGIAFNMVRAGVNDIDGRSYSGYPEGFFGTSEYQFIGAFGLRASEKLKAGIAFKYNYADLHDDIQAATSVGVDIGFLYSLNQRFTLGLVVQDLLAEYTWDSNRLYGLAQNRKVTNRFPVRVKSGLSYYENNITASADYEVRIAQAEFIDVPQTTLSNGQTTVTESVELRSFVTHQIRAGIAWDAHERITVRSGLKLPDLDALESWGGSAGFSVHLPFDKYSPSVDYAFVLEPNRLSNMHVFSLSLKL